MTEYVERLPRWQAIKWDGTNTQDVADFVAARGAHLLQAVNGGSLTLFTGGMVAVGNLSGPASWVIVHQAHYWEPIEFRTVADDNGKPVGFDEVV